MISEEAALLSGCSPANLTVKARLKLMHSYQHHLITQAHSVPFPLSPDKKFAPTQQDELNDDLQNLRERQESGKKQKNVGCVVLADVDRELKPECTNRNAQMKPNYRSGKISTY